MSQATESSKSSESLTSLEAAACSILGADELLGATRLAFFTPIRPYPAFADCKAAAIIAGNGLLISLMVLLSNRMEAVIHGNDLATYAMLLLLISFWVFLLIGCGCSCRALTLPIPHMPESLAYFPEIARLDLSEYRDRTTALTHRQVVHKMLIYNHSLSKLCVRKFALVRRATSCLQAQFYLWVLTTILVSFR